MADERRHRADEGSTFLEDALRAQGFSVDVDALERARRVPSGDLTWEQARAQIAAKHGPELFDESSRGARGSS